MVYPMIDVRPGSGQFYASRQQLGQGGFFLTEKSIVWAAEAYTKHSDEMENPLISLINHQQLGVLPKTMILTAGLDPLKDEAKRFSEQAITHNVAATYQEFPGTIHAFLSFFHRLDIAQEAIQKIRNWL